jgi:hypothetical protein
MEQRLLHALALGAVAMVFEKASVFIGHDQLVIHDFKLVLLKP